MPTKLSLDYQLMSGPLYKNSFKFPFDSIYLKETPFEVLKFLVKNYQIKKYLDINTNEQSFFNLGGIKGLYGFSIENGDLKGVEIYNSVNKELDLSFLSKLNLNEEQGKRKIEDLIRKYLITTHTKYGPITGGLIPSGQIGGKGPHPSSEEKITYNYFEERKKSENPEKEKELFQILQYAKGILNKSNFSIKNLEKMVSFDKFLV